MKILAVVVFVCLMASSAFGVICPESDMMGIYFDAAATLNYRADSSGPFDIYFCLTNPSASMIGGVEFGYQLTYDIAAFFRATETLHNSALQLGSSSDFNVGDYVLGYPAPVPVDPSGSNVIVSWNLSTFAPTINMSFFLTGPTTINSIPGYFGPVYLDGNLASVPAESTSPDGVASATIGQIPAPAGCGDFNKCDYGNVAIEASYVNGVTALEVGIPFERSLYDNQFTCDLGQVLLFYRYVTETIVTDYIALEMVGTGDETEISYDFTATIPRDASAIAIEYYITAWNDQSGAYDFRPEEGSFYHYDIVDLVTDDPAPVFTDATLTYPGLSDWGSGNSVTWLDYDKDGDLDLSLGAGGDNANQFFINQLIESGTTSFQLSSDPQLALSSTTRGVAWGILNSDDIYPDLYMGAPFQTNVLLNNNGTSTIDVTNAVTAGTNLGTNGIRFVDFNNDGLLDIHELIEGSPDRLMKNLGNWYFADIATGPIAIITGSFDAAWCDVDSDGDSDVYITLENLPNVLLRNDGAGVFTDITPVILADAGRGQGAAWGDYDNDGQLDLFLANWGTSDRLFHNEGNFQFTEITVPFGNTASHGQSSLWGDFDNDTDLDLYVTNYGEANQFFMNVGSGNFVENASGNLASLGSNVGAACGDYDNDGDLDLFVGTHQGSNILLRNALVSSNNWLGIRLVGMLTNPSAVGARITLQSGGVTQTREVGANNGFWSQNPFEQHFGLGTESTVDLLEVHWPSGIVTSHEVSQVNEILEVVEPTLWTDIAAGPTADTGSNSAVAYGDFDGDGDDDLYLVKQSSSEPNVLLVSNGDGTFTDCTPALLADTGEGTSASWGDFGNDGDLDLFLGNFDGPNRLFENIGPGGSCWEFQEVLTGGISNSAQTVSVEWVDYDHDGWIEVYVSNRDGANQMLLSRYGFTSLVPNGLDYPGPSQGAAWCDYDLDMDPDLYLVTELTEHQILEQDTSQDFVPNDITTTISGQGCSWADFDNDGDFDMFVTFWDKKNLLLENIGDGQFVELASPMSAVQNLSQAAVWGDYDNDGFIDLYLANYGNPNQLFHNDGGTGQFSLEDDPGLRGADNSIGAVWSDVDADGDLDLYVSNTNSANKLLRNELLSTNNWLEIKLAGHPIGGQSNIAALGALVKVEANGLTMWRSVSGGSGYASQSSLVQHFGLGGATEVDEVSVYWPFNMSLGGHHVTTLTAVEINQVLNIVELPIGVSEVPDGTLPTAISLGECYPNPFNPMTTIYYDLPQSARVDLRIYDIGGHLVKTLVSAELATAGRNEVVWQGQDNSGRQVAAGVYFYQLNTGGFSETKRMTLVK